jgi:hypothetical protein
MHVVSAQNLKALREIHQASLRIFLVNEVQQVCARGCATHEPLPSIPASVVTGVVSPTFSLPFDLVGDAGPTLACP